MVYQEAGGYTRRQGGGIQEENSLNKIKLFERVIFSNCSVCLMFDCQIITQEPLDRFASNLYRARTRKNYGSVLSLVLKF